MKKKIFTVVCVAIFGIAITCVCMFGNADNKRSNNELLASEAIDSTEEMEDDEKTIKMMKGDFPSTILIYGDDIFFREEAPKKNINELSDETLKTDSKYNFLIVNNLEAQIEFSHADWEILQRYVIDGSYTFIYLGKQYLSDFIDHGFIKDDISKTDCGFALRHQKNTIISTTGIWTDKENDIIKDEINYDYLEQSLLPYMKLVFLGV